VPGHPIQLHREQCFLVEVVNAPDLVIDDYACLPPGLWQAVPALGSADVPALEYRAGAVVGVREGQEKVTPPADALACVHRRAQQAARGQLAPERPADPVEGIVEVACLLREVKHGVLDPGAGRQVPGVPDPLEPARAMYHGSANRPGILAQGHTQVIARLGLVASP
jgi:hypothetical protein